MTKKKKKKKKEKPWTPNCSSSIKINLVFRKHFFPLSLSSLQNNIYYCYYVIAWLLTHGKEAPIPD
jgi:hypothetical protein